MSSVRGLRLHLAGALLLAFGSVACQSTPQKPPENPLMQARKDERINEENELEFERRHQAPPPAYGNKIVMAEADEKPTQTF